MENLIDASPAAPVVGDERLVVVLDLEGHRLVIDSSSVREIVAVVSITALPRVSRLLLGAVAVRGVLLPLYDVTEWCTATPATSNSDLEQFRDHFATILDVGEGSFAVRTPSHPKLGMSAELLTHRSPLLLEDDVCIGIQPSELLNDLLTMTSEGAHQ